MRRMGFGDQPYIVYRHNDIGREHLHIVSVNVDEQGRRLNRDFIHRRSRRITSELEKKYGLHPADRRQHRTDNPLRPVDTSQGDVRRQVSNVVKAVMAGYRFQTMGEYRALLSLYNVTVEEATDRERARVPRAGLFFAIAQQPVRHRRCRQQDRHSLQASRIGKSVATKPCSAGLNFPKDKFGINVWRR